MTVPDRLGITLSWDRDRRIVEITLRETSEKTYQHWGRQRDPASAEPPPDRWQRQHPQAEGRQRPL